MAIFPRQQRSKKVARVEQLITEADTLSVAEGSTPRALDAARRAVGAARELHRADGNPADQRRLAHALARLAAALITSEGAPAAVPPAREAGALVRQLITAADRDEPDADESLGDTIRSMVYAATVLRTAGERAEAVALLDEAYRAAEAAAGPAVHRARTLALAERLDLISEELVDSLQHKRPPPIPAEQLAALAVALVDDQRAIAVADGDTAIFDLATGLMLLGRVLVFVREVELAAQAWAEAVSILICFNGPAAKEYLDQALDRLNRLNQAVPHLQVVIPGPDAWRDRGSYAARLRTNRGQRDGAVPPGKAEQPDEAGRSDDPGQPDEAAPIAAASRSYEEGVTLSRSGRLREAEEVLDKAVSTFLLLEPGYADSPWHLEIKAKLSRALWRYSLVVQANGRPGEAFTHGMSGVTTGVDLLAQLPPGTDEHRAAVAEVVTIMADTAEIAAAAGRVDDQLTLLDEAISRCGGDPDPAVRRALGTALHNKATALFNRLLIQLRQGRLSPIDLGAAGAAATMARGVRRDLVNPADGLSVWEYANTLVLCAGIAPLQQRWAEGVSCLAEVTPLIRVLGPAAQEMRTRAQAFASMMERGAPDLVRRERAAGRWPN